MNSALHIINQSIAPVKVLPILKSVKMDMSSAQQNLFPWLSLKEESLFQDDKTEVEDYIENNHHEPVCDSHIKFKRYTEEEIKMMLINSFIKSAQSSNKMSPISDFEINPYLNLNHDARRKISSSNQDTKYYQNSDSCMSAHRKSSSILDIVKNKYSFPKEEVAPIDQKLIKQNWNDEQNVSLKFADENIKHCKMKIESEENFSEDVMEIDYFPHKSPKSIQESYEDSSDFMNEGRYTSHIPEDSEDVLSANQENYSQPDNIVFSCSNCIFSCTKVEILVNHFLRLHPNISNIFICPVCKFKSFEINEFKCHMTEHIDEQLFDCPCCEYVSSDPGYFELHMENHPEEKGFACLQCSYRARYFRDLQCHASAHTREKVVECSECDFKCCYKKELKNHMLIHTFDKPFSCSQCQYKCKTRWLLKTHMFIHTGEIQFACSQCDFRCNRKSSLLRHMLIHKREKPFSCSQCDYKCMQKEYMKKHMVIHTGEEPYSCTFCDFRCRYNYNLKKHLLVHGVNR